MTSEALSNTTPRAVTHTRPEAVDDTAPGVADDTTPEVVDELIGRDVLGRYRIVRLLAEGGMGRVYLAEQAVGTVVRRVAVKVLRKQLGIDRTLVARFSREAETLVRLTHPNTVQLFDFGALPDGTLALVMEYVEGHSLARELLAGPLSPSRAERVLSQVCGALQEAHAHGIVHRDLKPDNLLIAERVGHGDFIKVLDFGIAKVSAEDPVTNTRLTQQGMVIGTPPYMSPEQFSAEPVDTRSDVYSLGVIAYELLTGKLPFAAKTPWEWASKHLTTTPEELPLDSAKGLLARHALAIRRALSKRAEDRPGSVAEFFDVFSGRSATPPPAPANDPSASAGLGRTGTIADTPTDVATVRRALRRRGWIGATVAAMALVISVVAIGRGARHAGGPPAVPRPLQVAIADPPAAPSVAALPAGAALPPEPVSAAHAARPSEARASAERGRSRLRDRERTASSTSGPGEQREGALAAPLPLAVPATAKRTPSGPRDLPSGAPKPVAPVAIDGELQQRISQIRSAAASRVETAVGLYQAAAGKYGSAAALQSVRIDLERSGEKRIQELLSAGRCAQAQALFRALRSIAAAPQTTLLFGQRCPEP